MVNFTCNSCGDSLKKKDVAIHFARKINCRRAESLTCFDCLKVFGNDYANHTICVTEDQRYSANGLKGLQKNKQQVWTEAVHQHLSSVLAEKRPLSNGVKNIIENILKNPTVPKKEKQFFNFVRNMKKFVEPDIRTVWNIVSDGATQLENQALTNGNPQNKNSPKKSDSNGISISNGTNSLKKSKGAEKTAEKDESNVEEVLKEGKKKKKSKGSSELSGDAENGDTSVDLNESKKQKRRKEKSESSDISQTNNNNEETPMETEEQNVEVGLEKLSKKEKKLKKKKEKFEAEIRAVEAENINGEELEDEPAVEEKEKKKKKKQQQVVEVVELEADTEVDKKKKKRERTVSLAAETEQPLKKNKSKGYDENVEPNEEVEDVSSRRKDFNWADIIIQVLQSQDGNEMSVKRLGKKVVNEYLSSLLDGAHVDEVKATAKFQKKLHKTPGVFVHKDKARLKATD